MKRVLKVVPQPVPYILNTEIHPTDIVVQVYQKDASILLRVEKGKAGEFGFACIARRAVGRTLDWNTCSFSREEAIRRAAEGNEDCELYVFENQTEFFEACIKNGWRFIH